jgi:hypothetical protein
MSERKPRRSPSHNAGGRSTCATPKSALGDRKPKGRFRRQFPPRRPAAPRKRPVFTGISSPSPKYWRVGCAYTIKEIVCGQAREELAYRAQDRWLGLFGHDLATDFDDPFSLVVETKCFY